MSKQEHEEAKKFPKLRANVQDFFPKFRTAALKPRSQKLSYIVRAQKTKKSYLRNDAF